MSYCRYHPGVVAQEECSQCHLTLCAECAPAAQAGSEPNQCPLCEASMRRHGGAPRSAIDLHSLLGPPLHQGGAFGLLAIAVLGGLLSPQWPPALLLAPALPGLIFEALSLTRMRPSPAALLDPNLLPPLLLSRTALLGLLAVLQWLWPLWAWPGGFLCLLVLPLTQLLILQKQDWRVLRHPWAYVASLGRASSALGLVVLVNLSLALLEVIAWELLAEVIPQRWAVSLACVACAYLPWVSLRVIQLLVLPELDWPERASRSRRSAALDPQLARFRVWLREGYYDKAGRVLRLGAEAASASHEQQRAYVDLLLQLKAREELSAFIPRIFVHLLQAGEEQACLELLGRVLQIWPDYYPEMGSLRLALAQLLQQQGQLRVALRLLHAWHQQAPQDPCIPEAYILAADMLASLQQHGKARAMLRFVQERYRQHPLAAQARQRMASLPGA